MWRASTIWSPSLSTQDGSTLSGAPYTSCLAESSYGEAPTLSGKEHRPDLRSLITLVWWSARPSSRNLVFPWPSFWSSVAFNMVKWFWFPRRIIVYKPYLFKIRNVIQMRFVTQISRVRIQCQYRYFKKKSTLKWHSVRKVMTNYWTYLLPNNHRQRFKQTNKQKSSDCNFLRTSAFFSICLWNKYYDVTISYFGNTFSTCLWVRYFDVHKLPTLF